MSEVLKNLFSTRKNILLCFGLIILIHGLIISRLIFFPYPEFFVYPYLTNHGLLPYGQIFDQHFPGLMFLPINFNNLGMTTPEAARLWLIAIILISQSLLFFISGTILKSFKKALVVCFLYLLIQPFLEGYVLWIDTFLPLFYLPAFYFSYLFITEEKKDFKGVLLAGFFMSLAILFKQIALPLAGILLIFLFFNFRKSKTVTYFLAGFLPVLIVTTIYFWNLGVLADVWFWSIWFNLTTFAKYGRQGPTFSGLVRVLFIFSPALLLPFIHRKRQVILLIIFLLGGVVGALDRFDFVHFQPALPFLVTGLFLVFEKLWKNVTKKWMVCFYIAVLLFWLINFYRTNISSRVLFFDDQTMQVAQKIKGYTNEGEHIYLFGPISHLYFLTNTLPSGDIFVFQFPWFMMESENRFLAALKTDPPALIVRDRTVVIAGQSIKQFAHLLDEYIEENYVVFDRVGNTEFLKKKDTYASRI